MARSTKRLLVLLLAMILCVSLLPAAALAEEADEEVGTIAPVEEPEDLAEEPALDVPSDGAIAPADEPESLPPAADETQETYSGWCGANLTWSFDTETGVLTITGTGDFFQAEAFRGDSPFGRESMPMAYRSSVALAE